MGYTRIKKDEDDNLDEIKETMNMKTTKTELLEDMQQKITTFVEGYNEDQNFNYQVDNLMNEIGEALDRYRDSVVDWFEKEVIGEDGTDTREDLGETLWMAQWGRNDLRTEQRQLLKRKL